MKLSRIIMWLFIGTLSALLPIVGWAADQSPAKKSTSTSFQLNLAVDLILRNSYSFM
jgi:hypothetical protein